MGTSWRRGAASWGQRANAAAHSAAQRADDTTGEASERLARVIVPAVRLLRWPTGVVMVLPLPFIAIVLVAGLRGEGWGRVLVLIVGVVMALVSAAFWGRRRRILQAVEEPALLADELRQLANLTGRVDQTNDTLRDLAGGGGWRIFSRLRAAWRGATLPARWLDQIGDLPRARYFAPPKIGTTISVTVAALWLVPASIVFAVVVLIGSLAGSV